MMYVIGIYALHNIFKGIWCFSRIQIIPVKHSTLLAVSLLLFLSPIFSKNYISKKFTNRHGLSQSQVFAIEEDQYGFLWIGTQKGLNRFNGSTFINYYKNDHESFSSHSIWDLELDEQNRLWIGTDNGLFALSVNKSGIITDGIGPFLDDQIVFDLEIIEGKIWAAASTGVYLFKPDSNSFSIHNKTFSKDDQVVDYLFISPWKNDSILTCNVNDEFFVIGDNGKRPLKANVRNGFDAEFIHKNKVIIATIDGLAVFNGIHIEKITEEPLSEIKIPLEITNIGDELWIGTYNHGMYRLISQPDFTWELKTMKDKGLNSVRVIHYDHENNIWVGTDGSGLVRFHPSKFISYGLNEGLDDEVIWTVAVDPTQDRIVVGTYKGIGVIRDKIVEIPKIQKFLKKMPVNVVQFDNLGNLYIGTDNALYRSPPPLDTLIEVDIWSGQPNKVIYSLSFSPDNSIWIGSDTYPNLMNYYNGNVKSFTFGLNTDIDMIKDIEFDSNGNLWIITNQTLATKKGVLWKKFENENIHFYELFINEKDEILLGTENGVWQLNNDSFNQISIEFPSNTSVYSIVSDSNKTIWYGTDNGIYSQNEVSGELTHFTYHDGFIEHETNARASSLDQNGEVWFGTPHGVFKYEKESNINSLIPSIYLSFLKTESQSSTPDALIENPIFQPGDFTFELNTIFLGQDQNPIFRFMLIGLHENWVESSTPTIFFNIQKEKEYNLHYQALWHGNVMTEINKFPFSVKQKFWKKEGFFISIMGLYLALSLISLFKPMNKNNIHQTKNLKIYLFDKVLKLKIGDEMFEKSLFRSNIARSLLELLVLRKIFDDSGVKSEELGKIWWSKTDKYQIKNRKNVTLAKIRKLFSNAGIKEIIQFDKGDFHLNLTDDQWTCDVIEFIEYVRLGEMNKKKNLLPKCIANWEKAMLIFGHSGLLNEMKINEIEKYQTLLKNKATQIAEILIQHKEQLSNPNSIKFINNILE